MSAALGEARNSDWKGPKIEKSCDVSLVAFLSDEITITSLKCRHN